MKRSGANTVRRRQRRDLAQLRRRLPAGIELAQHALRLAAATIALDPASALVHVQYAERALAPFLRRSRP